jgi:aryl carrier-like protein
MSDIQVLAPCTPLQSGMISEAQTNDEAYFLSIQLRLAPNINLIRLKRAWETTFGKLNILRTKFIETDDGFGQVVSQTPMFPWTELDSSAYTSHGDASRSSRTSWVESNRNSIAHPFHLTLIKSPTGHTLVLHIFHGLYDGISLPLLFDTVLKNYHDKSVSYGVSFDEALPFLLFQRDGQFGEFWKNQLQPPWGAIVPHADAQGESRQHIRAKFSFQDVAGLDQARKFLNTTHQAIVQACWGAVMTDFFKTTFLMGVLVSGRAVSDVDAEHIIGPMFNTIPFHVKCDGDESWKWWVQHCHTFNISTLSRQHDPLREIIKSVSGTQRAAINNLFVFQSGNAGDDTIFKNNVWEVEENESSPTHAIAFEAQLKGTVLDMELVCDTAYIEQNALNELVTSFHDAMATVIRSPGEKINILLRNINTISRKPTARPDDQVEPSVAEFVWNVKSNILREEIAKLAGVEEGIVSPDISIFELGLDSIDIVKLSSRIRKRGVHISIRHFTKSPTIRKLAGLAPEISKPPKPEQNGLDYGSLSRYQTILTRLETMEHHGADRILPATPLQEAMIADMIKSEFRHYYNHDLIKLNKGTSVERLKDAWQSVVDQNPIYRTGFTSIHDTSMETVFAQLVFPPAPISWAKHNVSSASDIPHVLGQITAAASRAGTEKVLIEFAEFTVESEPYLAISLPHALYDGGSIRLLHEDVKRAYQGRPTDGTPCDNVLEEIINGVNDSARDFWRDYLFGASSCLIAMDAAASDDIGHLLQLESPTPLSNILQFCSQQGITLHSLTQTCWTLVLSSQVQKLEVIYGVVLSGRDSEESQRVQFPTMNTVAFRSILHGSLGDMLRSTHQDLANIREYQHYPLRKAKRLAHTDGHPLFDSLFLFQGNTNTDEKNDEPLYKSIDGQSQVEYPVCVEAEVVDSKLIWRCAARGNVLGNKEVQKLLFALDKTVGTIINDAKSASITFAGTTVSVASLAPFEIESDRPASQLSPVPAGFDGQEAELSPTERSIREVLSEVTGVSESEILGSSSLYHLGLDSISVIKLAPKLRGRGIVLRIRDILDEPTVSGIARKVDSSSQSSKSLATTVSPTPQTTLSDHARRMLTKLGIETLIDKSLPATSGQCYFLNVWKQSRGALFYSKFHYRVYGSVDKTALQTAWRQVVQETEVLRTVFIATRTPDDPFIQVILKPDGDGYLGVHDQPFHQVYFERLGSHEWSFGLRIHHALYDGVSLQELIRQFERALNSPSESRGFASSSKLTSPSTGIMKTFWTDYLEGLTVPFASPAMATDSVDRTEIFRPSLVPDMAAISKVTRQEGISIQSLVLAVYGQCYWNHVKSRRPDSYDSEDVVLGIYLANRYDDSESAERPAAFPTVNLVPLRVRVPKRASVLEAALAVHTNLAKIRNPDHSGVAMWQIFEWAGIRIDACVNFLSLPSEERVQQATNDIRVEEDTTDIFTPRGAVVRHETEHGSTPTELQGDTKQEHYTVSLFGSVYARYNTSN